MGKIHDLYLDSNILNIYPFGSQIYGTNTKNSDKDYIAVCKELPLEGSLYDKDNVCVHYLTVNNYQNLLDQNEIQALECHFLPKSKVIKQTMAFDLVINKENLRRSISTISSNSWVKGKKKLIIQGDYDKWLAIKSIFHSLRILNFGIQVAEEQSIYVYSAMNYILDDLIKIGKDKESVELWELIDGKYRETFNKLSSQFKKLCPIDKQKGVVLFKKEQKIVIDGKHTFDFKGLDENSAVLGQFLDFLDINYQNRK